MMKKHALLSILIIFQFLISFNLQSQSNISYGIKGGVNISNSSFVNTDSRTGYHIGLIAHKQYSNKFYLRSGIEFTTKGAKSEEHWIHSDRDDVRTWDYRLNYLQIPFAVGYKLPLNNATSLLINAGPYLSYGIYAKEKYTYTLTDDSNPTGTTYHENVSNGFGEMGFHRFDFGVTAGMGVEYKQYLLNIGYESGILNLTSGMYDGGSFSWRNQNITLSVGYFFKN